MKLIQHFTFKLFCFASLFFLATACKEKPRYFEIHVVDEATGRGIPMVELKTIDAVEYFTDSDGRIAFFEPGQMEGEQFFYVDGLGYTMEPDHNAQQTVTLDVVAGGKVEIALTRRSAAERLYRTTGAGIYKDSYLLGYPSPIKAPLGTAKVRGQDSNLGARYKGKYFWGWGDTFRPNRYEGNFHVAAAWSNYPENGGLDPDVGIDYEYITNADGFTKEMLPMDKPGYIWFDWLLTIPDAENGSRLLGKYARVNGLFGNFERGVAAFNDSAEVFEKVAEVEGWMEELHTCNHPFLAESGGEKMYYTTGEFRFQRVAPTMKDITDAKAYESFTCLKEGASFDAESPSIEIGKDFAPVWGWKKGTDAIGINRMHQLIDKGHLSAESSWLQLRDIESGEYLKVHRGSIYWNAFREKWVLIVGRGFGEIWYSEGDTPIGPWAYASKVAHHDMFFYNPVQHPSFAKNDGQTIYFEGTYTRSWTDPTEVPQYNYNQLMYRLQLDQEQTYLPEPIYWSWNDGFIAVEQIKKTSPDSEDLVVNFFAIPEGRNWEGLLPIYQKDNRLSTEGDGEPIFYACPFLSKEDSLKRYAGDWKIDLRGFASFHHRGRIKLNRENGIFTTEKAVGPFVSSAVGLKGDSLSIQFDFEDAKYELTAFWQGNELKASWAKKGGKLKGEAIITALDQRNDRFFSADLVPLYEFYNTNASTYHYVADSSNLVDFIVRTKKPICRVWKNHFSQTVFDFSIQATEPDWE